MQQLIRRRQSVPDAAVPADCICEEDFSFRRPEVDTTAEADERTEKMTLLAGAILFAGVEIYHEALQLKV